uniref:PEHE domain-containing protein n=1 Tax=Macrostomum lignano TaxID=282301 RepID=A0A1I8JMG2_9PLAT
PGDFAAPCSSGREDNGWSCGVGQEEKEKQVEQEPAAEMHCYDSSDPEVFDTESPVLVYEPQSHATPVREAAAAAAVAARRSRAQRRRRHRGNAEDKDARAGCLTGNSVGRCACARGKGPAAAEPARASRRCSSRLRAAATASEVSWAEQLQRRDKVMGRLNGRSASLDSRAGGAATPTAASGAIAHSTTGDAIVEAEGGRRLGELRRMLRDPWLLNDRRADKSLQSPACNASSVGDGIEESFEQVAAPRLRQATQFPLPVRQSPDCCDEAGDWGFESA